MKGGREDVDTPLWSCFFRKIWMLSKEIIESRYIGAFKIICKLLISKLDILKLSVIWRNCRYRNCQENDQTIIVIEKMTYRWPLAEGGTGWEASESDKQVLLLWLRLSTSSNASNTLTRGAKIQNFLDSNFLPVKTFWKPFHTTSLKSVYSPLTTLPSNE